MEETKNVLITGAAQGIGAGIAWAYGQAGYHVIAADLEGSRLQATVRGLVAEGFDVSDGLFDHLDSVQNNERYFWKPRIKLY